jgi:probable HAF family extracellular repeat protein
MNRPNLEVLEDRCVPTQYAVTDLGTLGGYATDAYDLNEAGQVVGFSYTPAGLGHAFLSNHGTIIDLGTLGGSSSLAHGINDLGQVVGWANPPGDVNYHAFLLTPQGGLWFQDNNNDGRNDFMIDLGTLNGSNDAEATDINNAGQVVGDSGGRPFLWDAVNGMTDLGGYGWATGINETGQITGVVTDALSGTESAFLWDAAHGMTVLGAGPNYADSRATAINDAGQVVGFGWNSWGNDDSAFVWTPDSPNGLTGNFTDLGMLAGFALGASVSNATGINNAGQVVGFETGEGTDYHYHPFLWDTAGGLVDVPYDIRPVGAEAINDSGAITINGWDKSGRPRAYLLTPLPPGTTPSISIVDAPAVTEGNAGWVNATFTLTLSHDSNVDITVHYATVDISAAAGSDYVAAAGDVVIPAGQTNRTLTVAVKGDRLAEPNEIFFVNLSSPTNATIADGQGAGTIVDDEPRISISDVSKKEGKNHQTTQFTFTVTLSAAFDQPVTMSFKTTDDTAKMSDSDYVAKIGTLTFAPGETTKTITIVVNGDNKKETDETFYLDLSGLSSNALFTKNRGIGTILNDD